MSIKKPANLGPRPQNATQREPADQIRVMLLLDSLRDGLINGVGG